MQSIYFVQKVKVIDVNFNYYLKFENLRNQQYQLTVFLI